MLFLLFTAGTLVAQTRISSPYSRYGVGDLQNSRYMRNMSMGGLSLALHSSNAVNYSNPASYTSFDSTSYVFETGINSLFVRTQTTENSQNSNYSTLGCLVMGFPVTNWWGASIGLLPYSSVGYKIANENAFPVTGQVKYRYEGSGGLNRFYAGNAFKIAKNLSVGINTSFVFGTIDKTRTVYSPDSAYFLNLRMKNGTIVNDFLLDYGLQYTKKIKNDLFLDLGLVFSNSTNLTAKQDSFAVTYLLSSTDTETDKDTIVNSSGNKGKIVIPQNIGFGFCIGNQERWLAGADVSMQNWEKFSSFGEKYSLKNSMQASVGFEFTPRNTAVSGYWKKVHYRVGARYNKTYLQIHNNQLDEYGISFGFGLPLKRSKTAINLAFEMGQRGTIENELIKENFGRISLCLSVYERWFLKRKFD